LMPIEKLETFDKLERKEPSQEYPIRRYEPIRDKIHIEDSSLKPGFLEQYKAFYNYCINREVDTRMTDLKAAITTLKVCHEIIKDANITRNFFGNL